jgi:Pilus assembly protein, PilO
VTAALKLDFSPRVFAATLLGLVLVVGGATWFMVISPKQDRATSLQAAIGADRTKLAAAQHTTAQQTGGQEGQQTAAQAALPDALAMPQIVDQLDALADQSNVTLDTVTPAAVETGTGYTDVPLTVVVDGNYFSVEKFLHLVRNQVTFAKDKVFASGRLFDVESMQLNGTEPAPEVTATFQMKAFYFTPGAAPPAPAPTTTTDTASTGS